MPTGKADCEVKENDEIIAKCCHRCHQWNKGTKLHHSRECNREAPTGDNTEPLAPPPAPEGNLADTDSTAGTPSLASTTDSSLATPSGMLGLRGAACSLPNSFQANQAQSQRSANLDGI